MFLVFTSTLRNAVGLVGVRELLALTFIELLALGHGPLLGEHTQEVLAHTLGYSQEQVEELYSENILHIEEAAKSLVKQ